MKYFNSKFLTILCFIFFLALTANNSYAQTTVNLPSACDSCTGGGNTGAPAPGALPLWVPTAADWSGTTAAGDLILDISSIQAGQCIDTWPSGFYRVRFTNTSGASVVMYGVIGYNTTAIRGDDVTLTTIASGETRYLSDIRKTSSGSFLALFDTQVTRGPGSSTHNQYGSVKQICRRN